MGGVQVLQWVGLIICLLPVCVVEGYFEFCSGTTVHTISQADCPGGVLFAKPVSVKDCFYPSADSVDHSVGVCEADPQFSTTSTKLDLDKGKELRYENELIQYIDTGENDDTGPSSASYATDTCKTKCGGGDYASINSGNTRNLAEGIPEQDSSEEVPPPDAPPPEDPLVVNQTLRLFMYMTGNLFDETDPGPDMRVAEVLRQSIQVAMKHAPEPYMRTAFLENIERAFFFLLREGGVRYIKDISIDQFRQIKKVLEGCMNGGEWVRPVSLSGKVCKVKAKVNTVGKLSETRMDNTTKTYAPTEQSFKWGWTDFISEAIWGVADFVHGMCYSGFNMNVNNHHLYQRAMERLFTPEMLYRWQHPQKLKDESYWDNIFESNVKNSMRSLDAAIMAAYIESPFLDRLRPPWIKMVPAPITRRRKRQAESSLAGSAWCLQTPAEKTQFMSDLRKKC